MVLDVYEGGDAAWVYGGKVDEEHVYAACPSICLLGSALDIVYQWRRVLCIMLIAGGGRRLRELKY